MQWVELFLSVLFIRPIGLFQFRIISEIMNNRQTVGLLGRVISSSQGLYLHRTTQQRQTMTNIHALSGIRTRDPVYEHQGPRLRPRGRWIGWVDLYLQQISITASEARKVAKEVFDKYERSTSILSTLVASRPLQFHTFIS
jgi:hypothetical protein